MPKGYPLVKRDPVARFVKKTQADPKTGCLNFIGSSLPSGYGTFRYQGKIKRAHRVAWEFRYGPIENDLHVLHKCDNRRCVNTDHLFLGTEKDNSDDKMSKGRDRKSLGSANRNAKLTEAVVLEIRASGKRPAELAREYGMHISTMCSILSGEYWKHIMAPIDQSARAALVKLHGGGG